MNGNYKMCTKPNKTGRFDPGRGFLERAGLKGTITLKLVQDCRRSGMTGKIFWYIFSGTRKMHNMVIRNIKPYAPYLVLLGALFIGALSLFGDNNFSKLRKLETSLEQQKKSNTKWREEVTDLRHEVHGLQTDARAIEKAARNELGMARPNEKVFIFESPKGSRNDGK